MVYFAAMVPEGESGSFFLFSVSLFSGLCFIKAALLTSHPLRDTRYSAGEEDEDTAPLINQSRDVWKGLSRKKKTALASVYKLHSKERCFQFTHYKKVIQGQVQCHGKEVLAVRSTTHTVCTCWRENYWNYVT